VLKRERQVKFDAKKYWAIVLKRERQVKFDDKKFSSQDFLGSMNNILYWRFTTRHFSLSSQKRKNESGLKVNILANITCNTEVFDFLNNNYKHEYYAGTYLRSEWALDLLITRSTINIREAAVISVLMPKNTHDKTSYKQDKQHTNKTEHVNIM